MQIILVHNTDAGDGHYDASSLLSLIRAQGHQVEYFEATDNWKPFAQSRVELVVAAGGDGTVEDVARHLAGSGIPIAVLPLGTANNVASALGVSETPIPELVAGWVGADRWPFDTGLATTEGRAMRFVESVGVGLLTEAFRRITRGSAGYVDRLADAQERMDAAIEVLRETLRLLEPTSVELTIDGRKIAGEYLLLEVMNFGCAGPSLCLVPDASQADGLFEIVLAEVGHRARLIDDLPLHQRRNDSLAPPRLPAYRGRHVILSSQNLQLHVDDQLLACHGPVELVVEPRALTFLVSRRLPSPGSAGRDRDGTRRSRRFLESRQSLTQPARKGAAIRREW
jgi:diacylglycerol kinase (ATP)